MPARIDARFRLSVLRRNAAHIADQLRIAQEPGWVAEGIYVVLVDPLLEAADVIVLLDVPWPTAAWRMLKRHVSTTMRGTNAYPGLRPLWRLVTYAHGFYTNRPTDLETMIEQSLTAQRGLPRPPTTEALVQHLETYHPVSIPPTVAYVRRYLARYQDTVVVVRTHADHAQVLKRLPQPMAARDYQDNSTPVPFRDVGQVNSAGTRRISTTIVASLKAWYRPPERADTARRETGRMGRPLPEKLGINHRMRAFFVNAPPDVLDLLAAADLTIAAELTDFVDYIHVFTTSQAQLADHVSETQRPAHAHRHGVDLMAQAPATGHGPHAANHHQDRVRLWPG